MESADPRKQLGKLLKTRREAAGLTTRALGARAGVDDSTIVRLEQGVRSAPRPDVLAKLSSALNITLSDLFALAGYANSKELPSLPAYLRVKYPHLPQPAQHELVTYMRQLYERYGFDTKELAQE